MGAGVFLIGSGFLGYQLGQVFSFGAPGPAITPPVLLASVVIGVLCVPFWVITFPLAFVAERLARVAIGDPDEQPWRPPGYATPTGDRGER